MTNLKPAKTIESAIAQRFWLERALKGKVQYMPQWHRLNETIMKLLSLKPESFA